MFHIRIESSAEAWRSFRWTTYLRLLGIAPFGEAGAVSAGSGFGTGLLAALALCYGISVFGVEFTIHQARQPRIIDFDAEGSTSRDPRRCLGRFADGNSLASGSALEVHATLRCWRSSRSVRVCTSGCSKSLWKGTAMSRSRSRASWLGTDRSLADPSGPTSSVGTPPWRRMGRPGLWPRALSRGSSREWDSQGLHGASA